MKHIILTILATIVLNLPTAESQNFGVKTNLLSDAAANITAAAEIGLAPQWTFEVGGSFNAWDMGEKQWKHWELKPEARYWFCDTFAGHFIGMHVFGGQYNVGGIDTNVSLLGTDYSKLKDHRFQGWFGGVGFAYGYAWALSHHWNIEAELGMGYAYTRYDMFRCTNCGRKEVENKPHHYFGPTKVAFNVVYLF